MLTCQGDHQKIWKKAFGWVQIWVFKAVKLELTPNNSSRATELCTTRSHICWTCMRKKETLQFLPINGLTIVMLRCGWCLSKLRNKAFCEDGKSLWGCIENCETQNSRNGFACMIPSWEAKPAHADFPSSLVAWSSICAPQKSSSVHPDSLAVIFEWWDQGLKFFMLPLSQEITIDFFFNICKLCFKECKNS